MTNFLRLIIWIAGLSVALRQLLAMGAQYPVPGSDDARFGDPALVVGGVLRLIAIAFVAYLLAAIVVTLLARITRYRPLMNFSKAVTPIALRRVTGLTLAATLTAVPNTPSHASDDVPILRKSAAVSAMASAPSTTTTTTATPSTPQRPHNAAANHDHSITPLAAPEMNVTTYTVQPDDNFWSIAAAHVGPDASKTEVHAYWRQLISANKGELVTPGRPDLLIPGQILFLPEF